MILLPLLLVGRLMWLTVRLDWRHLIMALLLARSMRGGRLILLLPLLEWRRVWMLLLLAREGRGVRLLLLLAWQR